MKFLTNEDAQFFYFVEMDQPEKASSASKETEPTQEEIETFLKKRREESDILKDRKKSSDSKSQWRSNRYNIMRGIKAYHRSTEGKRFHRKLGNFLATRMTGGDESFNTRYETAKCLSSAKTHMLVEMEYYHPLLEQRAVEEMLSIARRMVYLLEDKLLYNKKLSVDEYVFLLDITETAAVVKALADKSGQSVSKVESMWDSIKDALIKSGKSDSDDKFYGLLTSILKKKLNLT